ncbi:uncharacterized protein LOC116413124 isoform X2 [Galleria mellonella]|nr:uncharacterized protein LOC116413124 isoform X2 [Galleria mellonella]
MQRDYQWYDNYYVPNKELTHKEYKRRNVDISKDYIDDFNYREQCKCFCSKCNGHNKCCKSYCRNCQRTVAPQSNLILFPYPVPVIVTDNLLNIITTTAITTETKKLENATATSASVRKLLKPSSSTTTTEKLSTVTNIKINETSSLNIYTTINEDILPLKTNDREKAIFTKSICPAWENKDYYTSLEMDNFKKTTKKKFKTIKCVTSGKCLDVKSGKIRNKVTPKDYYTFVNRPTIGLSQYRAKKYSAKPLGRRTASDWVPKYGIVPIPDNLAINFMSQLKAFGKREVL